VANISTIANSCVNRFEKFQAQKQQIRVELISDFLSFSSTCRVKYKCVTDLALVVSNYICEREGKACNKSTLLRNPKYKSMLLNFMAKNMLAGTKNSKVKSILDPQVHALYLEKDLALSNASRDNDRLRIYISKLEQEVSGNIKKSSSKVTVSDIGISRTEFEKLKIRNSHICRSLQLLILNFDSLVSVDFNTKQIIDMTKLRNNVIVNSALAEGFFEWMAENHNIG
jgi:hypothetical protein